MINVLGRQWTGLSRTYFGCSLAFLVPKIIKYLLSRTFEDKAVKEDIYFRS
jgi:hypothetical protein